MTEKSQTNPSNNTANSGEDTEAVSSLKIDEEQLNAPIDPYRTESLSDLREETLKYFRLAKRSIQIYSENLDPRVLNTRDIEGAVLSFVRSSRKVKVEILIIDERAVQSLDHRLVKLAQNYTSYLSIKIIPKDFHENPFAFYILDGKYLLYRTLADRYECEVHQLPSSKVKQVSKYFEDVWGQSDPAIHLRALFL